LVVLDVDAPWLHTNYGFAWPRECSLTPAAHDFIEQVREVEAELVEAERKAAEPFA
jgi:DNA-binding transcriptional LysR family regulator